MKLSDRMYYVWLDVSTMMLKLNNSNVEGAIAAADAVVEAATERFDWITVPAPATELDKSPDPEVEYVNAVIGGTENG